MAVNIVVSPEFTTKVALNTVYVKGVFAVTYVAMRTSKLKALEKQATAEGKGPDAILHHVVKDFETLEVDGESISFAEGGLEKLLDIPGAGPAMVGRYYTALWEEASGN